MEYSGHELRTQMGVMRAPREMGGGSGLLQEALLLAAQETKPYKERLQDAHRIPCPRTLCRELSSITALLWSEGVNTGDFPELQNRCGQA